MNNDKERNTTSKITKELTQKSRHGTSSNKITEGGGGGGGGGFNNFAVDQTSPLVLPRFVRQNNYNKGITSQNH